ncbi:hypothetical protein RQP53_03655 [Paucibacter sp. APW11]|uniref:Uncharacterized protein n=1 Tax=Roseateles aquae TaxID=3077235 RepID=A0ABU3P744_9BURK|nr:hypothetical protein [Paucibacter sp. APW11]MDT8998369.1 hypothetical protein [Paucibacter sp. APW11]
MSRALALTGTAQRALAAYMVKRLTKELAEAATKAEQPGAYAKADAASMRNTSLEYALVCLIGALGGEAAEREFRQSLGKHWNEEQSIPLQGQSIREHAYMLANSAGLAARRAAC